MRGEFIRTKSGYSRESLLHYCSSSSISTYYLVDSRGFGRKGNISYIQLICKSSFDLGASHSFIVASFVLALVLESEDLSPHLFIDTSLGGRAPLDRICRGCELIIRDRRFIFYFIVLGMSGFDLILGADWLSTFHVTIDCYKRRVYIFPPKGNCFDFFGKRQEPLESYLCEPREWETISCLWASLTLDEDLTERGETPLVVCDFSDVFPEEFQDLPHKREV
ncbi:hypothetical protein Vadar_005875 [Vaccinium darrowii]|uniref:Uncharacterized protein n=1 Tax=Vaccinium darrowii TaxID=229202 RepID=A0ACB7Z1W9_9ERIC|nr:hypothetical protein Vadar_005875 [Vaccinium darrowii]